MTNFGSNYFLECIKVISNTSEPMPIYAKVCNTPLACDNDLTDMDALVLSADSASFPVPHGTF
jgi:hypothetical protein